MLKVIGCTIPLLIRLVLVLFVLPTLPDAQEAGAPAVVKAEKEAILSSLVSGVIAVFHFNEGEAFRIGDTLVDLDCRLYDFEADVAGARRKRAFADLSAHEKLFERGGVGALEVAAIKAEADAADAQAKAAALRVDYCTIRAPFDGRITEHVANEFEYMETGQPVLKIVSSGAPDLEIIIPAAWLAWIELGTRGRLKLEASARELPISITSIAPTIDPVSRTMRIAAKIDADAKQVLPGMSGLVTLEQKP